MEEIFIIILNWNGKNDTLECLESLEAVTTPHHTVVVDNGSSDDSVTAIRAAYPAVTVLETEKNLGYAEGNNAGIRYALEQGATALLILNNDTVVAPDILEGFLKHDVPIQGATPFLYTDRKRLDHLGGMWNRKKGVFDLIGLREEDGEKWHRPYALDYVCGCALFAQADVFRNIGGFEPRFFLFWEESDWCFRAKQKGYAIQSCPDAKLWHKVSASFTGGKPHTTYFWWRNRFFWIERNCSKKEKTSLFFRVLLPEVSHHLKLFLLKSLQLGLLKVFKPKGHYEEKESRLKNYRAALIGTKDYLFRRFGSGPF